MMMFSQCCLWSVAQYRSRWSQWLLDWRDRVLEERIGVAEAGKVFPRTVERMGMVGHCKCCPNTEPPGHVDCS